MNADEQVPGFPKIDDVVGGCYRLQSLVSTERAGVTFRATHVAFGRTAMVKVASAEALDAAGGADRLLRATRLMTDLESDHVARITAGGKLEGGGAYLVLPWLDGCTIADLLQAGSLPTEVAVDYVLQACEALAEMHGRGMVHRALRPENLFLFRGTDGTAYVKLLCCGTAKVGADGGGIPLPSPPSAAYDSPEQMADPRSVDERSDVWSLGVILFELVTQALPFGDGSGRDVMSAILMEPRPKASDHEARLPAALDDILGRCMRQRRADRMPNVETLAEELVPYGGPSAAATAARIAEIGHTARSGPRSVLAVAPPAAVSEGGLASDSSQLPSAPESMAPTAQTVRPPTHVDRGARTVRPVVRARRRMVHLSAALVVAASLAAAFVSIGPQRTAAVSAGAPPAEVVASPPPELAPSVVDVVPAPLPLPITATHMSAPPRLPAVTARPKDAPPPQRPRPHTYPRLSTTVFPESTPEEAFHDRK